MTHAVLVWFTSIYQIYKCDDTLSYDTIVLVWSDNLVRHLLYQWDVTWYGTCCVGIMSHDITPVVWTWCHMLWNLLFGQGVTWYDTCCVDMMSKDMTPVAWTWCHMIWHLLCGHDVTWYDTCCVGMISQPYDTCFTALMSQPCHLF